MGRRMIDSVDARYEEVLSVWGDRMNINIIKH
jgi:hypothetical protein